MQWHKKLWLMLGLLLLTSRALAEGTILSLSQLPDDETLLIGRYLAYWEAPLETIDDAVLQGHFDQEFQQSHQDLPGRGFAGRVIWLRLVLDNPNAETRLIHLDSRYALMDSVTLFQKDAAGIYQGESQGDNQPQNMVRPPYRIPSFKMHIPPGQHTYYLKMKAQGSIVIALYLATPEAERLFQLQDIAGLGLFFGIMLTLLFYNAFLTFSFRSTTYFYYTLFLLAMLNTQISLQGLWPLIFPGPIGAWANNTGFLVSGCLGFLASGLVSMSFLNMREHMKFTYFIFKCFHVLSLVMLPLVFVMSYSSHVKIMSSIFLVGSFIMLGSSLLAVARGYRPAFAYSFAWFFMIIGNIMLALTYEGFLHIPLVVQWANLPGLAAEGILMSLALGDRVNYFRAKDEQTIHELNQELQKNLIQVEALVAERTETIRTIIDNVASGFLMINRAGMIVPGFTRSCHALLGSELSEGLNFIKLIGTKPAVEKKFRMALDQIFDDQMPLDVTLAQLPSHVLSHDKYVHIEAAGVRDKHGVLQHLLLTLTDATELRKRKIEAQRNRSLLKIMQDIEGFKQFVAYSHEAVQKLKNLHRTTHSASSREVQFILHTLKGNCLVFQLPEIARILHQLEEKASIRLEDIEVLEEQFKKYLIRHANLLRTAWGPISQEKRVTDDQLQALQDLARARFAPPIRVEIDRWIQSVAAKPVRNVLHSLINDARVVARKLKKEVDFHIEDREARIHSDAEEHLIEELIHIIRNAIVHGIEEDRDAAQKPKRGSISLEFRELKDGLSITCLDDGRGFDRRIWEAEWVARKLPITEDLSRVALVDLISAVTRGGFSTQEKVSLFAGRGVGIEALFAAVHQCEGTMNIISELGQGCRFEIFVPRSESFRSAS